MTAAIIIISAASFVDGAVEGFTFDGRRFFEVNFGAKEYGFWGSMSHAREKTLYEKLFGMFDFYHVCDDIRKYGYLSGGFLLALNAGLNWFYIAIAVGLSILLKRIGMAMIRL